MFCMFVHVCLQLQDITHFWKLLLMTAVDHLVPTEGRVERDTLSVPGSVSQGEYLAVQKMGFYRSSLFLAVVFWSIPYMSGGVLFLGHSSTFPFLLIQQQSFNPVWDIFATHHPALHTLTLSGLFFIVAEEVGGSLLRHRLHMFWGVLVSFAYTLNTGQLDILTWKKMSVCSPVRSRKHVGICLNCHQNI